MVSYILKNFQKQIDYFLTLEYNDSINVKMAWKTGAI